MPIGLVELVIILAAVIGSGGMVAVLGWLWYRTRRLEEPHRSLEELHDLRQELAATRETTRELRERLDFLENLLEPGEEAEEKPKIEGER